MSKHSLVLKTTNFNPLTPRSDFSFYSLAATHILVNWLREFGARSRQLLPDKFEYSHQLFAE